MVRNEDPMNYNDDELYRARRQDIVQEMERNEATADLIA